MFMFRYGAILMKSLWPTVIVDPKTRRRFQLNVCNCVFYSPAAYCSTETLFILYLYFYFQLHSCMVHYYAPQLSQRGNKDVIHSNTETQLQGVKSSCKQLNSYRRGSVGFWEQLSFLFIMLKQDICLWHEASRGHSMIIMNNRMSVNKRNTHLFNKGESRVRLSLWCFYGWNFYAGTQCKTLNREAAAEWPPVGDWTVTEKRADLSWRPLPDPVFT